MTEVLENPVTIETTPSEAVSWSGILSPELLEKAGIPKDTFQFDYNNYVEDYEVRKTYERLEQLKIIGSMAEELDRHVDNEDYDKLRQIYDAYVEPINYGWGKEFDNDLINLLGALLIDHKDITLVVQPKTELFWYDRLDREIHGIPYDQDEHYIDEVGAERQVHPGRPDMDKIKLRVYEMPDSILKMRRFALAQSVVLAA